MKSREEFKRWFLKRWGRTNYDKTLNEIYDYLCEPDEPLQEELKELREKCEKQESALASGVHTCSNKCKRPMCVLRRERDQLQADNRELRDAIWHASESLKFVPMDSDPNLERAEDVLREALARFPEAKEEKG